MFWALVSQASRRSRYHHHQLRWVAPLSCGPAWSEAVIFGSGSGGQPWHRAYLSRSMLWLCGLGRTDCQPASFQWTGRITLPLPVVTKPQMQVRGVLKS